MSRSTRPSSRHPAFPTRGALICLFIALLFLGPGVARAATVVEQGSGGLYVIEGGTEPDQKIYSHTVLGFGVSPNGEEVVFTPYGGEDAGKLMIYDLESEATSVISSMEKNGMGWLRPRFTPDGKKIIGESQGGLFSIDTDGSSAHRLLASEQNAFWPVMSSDGYLAYLDEEGSLYVLNPTKKGEPSTPRLIASGPAYEGVSERPSFSPLGNALLYPTTSGSYVFDAETGELLYTWPLVYNNPEWVTPESLLEMNGSTAIRVTIGSWGQEGISTIFGGSAVRGQQPAGEIEPPFAPIPLHQLLEDFRPILKYDAQESYRATPAQSITWPVGLNEEHTKVEYVNFLKRGERVLADPLYEPWANEEFGYSPQGLFALDLFNLGESYPIYGPPDESAAARPEDLIDEHNGTHMEDAANVYDGLGTVHGHVVLTGDGAWLQYWLFYYYNNGVFGIGDHEGDWELVQVHLSRDTGYLPDEVVFSQHSYAARCQSGEYETEDGYVPGPGGAPIVFVANGSHASYPEEGSYSTEAPLVYDTIDTDIEEVPAVHTTLQDLDLEELSWLYWPGEWGGSGSSPQGPAFHGTQWVEPDVWGEAAEDCTANKIGERQLSRKSGGVETSVESALLSFTASALRNNDHVLVRYRITNPPGSGSALPERIQITVDSIHDHLTPKTFEVVDPERVGTIISPFRVDSDKRWRVRGSVGGPKEARSPVVTRAVDNR